MYGYSISLPDVHYRLVFNATNRPINLMDLYLFLSGKDAYQQREEKDKRIA